MATMDETFVEYGFYKIGTAPEMTAWRKDAEDGGFWLITTDDGHDRPTEESEMILVTWYETGDEMASGDLVSFEEFRDHFML